MNPWEVPHAGFIVAAFAVTALLLGGTVAAILWDYGVQRRQIARLSGDRDRDTAA